MDVENQISKDDLSVQAKKEKKHTRIKSSRKSSLDFRKYTKQIWLAGLGAFSRAEEEGNKLFDALVKVGEELESKSVEVDETEVEQQTHKVVEKTKETVAETKEKFEKTLDAHVNHSLNRIGLVTVKDIQHLEALILQLHQKVDGLVEENKNLSEQLQKIANSSLE
ncbi:phasin family protein [Acinetobacter defluvii]|uniref:phasin family protein n=1 Tax=Acinetobacter defluvii TaxID=1871111 RepID=UPI003AF412F2